MAIRAAELEVIVTADASQATDEINATNDALGRIGQFAVGEKLIQWGQDALGFAKNFIVSGAAFAQEMNFVDKLTGDSGQYFQALQDKALQMGEKTIFSAQEVAQGMEQLAREGFTPLQIIGTNAFNSMIDGATNMAAALRIQLDDAANMLGMTERVFADQNISAAKASDILTQAVLRSGKSAADFQTAWQYVGVSANQLHIPMEQAAAAVGLLESQGLSASKVGTGLQQFLNGLTTEGSKAQKAMADLGISALDQNGNFRGLLPVLSDLHDAYVKMNDSQKTAFAEALSGGQKASAAVKQLLQDGPQGILDFIDKMHKLGSAASIMGSLVDTTAGSFHILQSSIFTAEKVMGDAVDGYIKPLVDAAAALVNAFIAAPPVIHLVAAALVILGGIALILAGGLLIALAIGIDNIVAAAALGIEVVAGIAAVFGLLAAALVLVKPKIDEFRQTFQTATMLGMDPFNAALTALRFTIPQLAPLFDFIRAKGDEMRVTFQTATMLGMNPFQAALEALRFAFPSLAPMFDDFRKAGDRLTAAYGQDGLRGVLLALPGAIKLVADGLVQGGIALAPVALHVLTWTVSEIATGAENLAGSIAKFVKDNYKDVKADVDSAGARVVKWVVNEAETLYDTITKFVHDHYNGVVSSLDKAGANVKQWVLTETTPLAKAVEDWVKKNLTVANLSDVGKTIGDKVAAAINAISWGAVGQTLGYGLGTALAAGIKLAGALVTIAINVLKDGQLYSALYNAAVHLIEGFAKGFADAIQQQFPGLAGKVTSAWSSVKQAFDNLPKPIQDAAKAVGDAIHDITKPVVGLGLAAIGIHLAFGVIADAATALAAPLIAAGAAAIAAAPEILIIAGAAALAYEGFKHWDTISGYVQKFGNVAGPAAGAVTALGVALGVLDPPLGLLILAALGLGEVVSHFDAVKKAVSDLGSAIQGAWSWINNLAKLVWGPISGADAFVGSLGAVKGALNGLTAAYNAAQTALNWISSHVGGGGGNGQSPYSVDPNYKPPNSQVAGLTPIAPPWMQELPQGGAGGGGTAQVGFNQDPRAFSRYAPLGSAGLTDLPGGFVPGVGAAPGLGNIQATGLMSSDQQGGAAAEFQQMTTKMNGQAQALTGQLTAAGTAAGQGWARALGAGLQTGLSAVTAVVGAVDKITSGLTGKVTADGTASGNGWARALGAGLQTGLSAVTAVVSAIDKIVSALTGKLTTDGTTSGTGWARSLGTGLQLGLTAVTAVTTAIITIMSAWGTRTVQIGQQTGQQMAVAWGQGLQLALTATTAVMTAMNTIITTAFTQMKTTAQNNANGMATSVSSAFHSMQNTATNDANSMRSSVTNAFNAMKSNGQAAVNDLSSAVGSAFNSMKSKAVSDAQSMMSQVTGAINAGADSAAGAAYNAGIAIGAGLANGMNAELGAVQAAAAALANAASAAANVALNAHSPSLVFFQKGLWVGQGFVLGIRASLADAARAVRDGVLPAIEAANGAVSQALARPGATVAAGRGGTTVVYVTNNNTVRVDDLPDVIRAAQFVRDSDSVRQLIMGTT